MLQCPKLLKLFDSGQFRRSLNNIETLSVSGFRISVILYCFEFRISDFEILFLSAGGLYAATINGS